MIDAGGKEGVIVRLDATANRHDVRTGGLFARPLRVPALPRPLLAQAREEREREARVFDAWGWCASDVLDWRIPAPLVAPDDSPTSALVDAGNPPDLVFVFHEGADDSFLPRELARFHAKGYGLENEWALAPYAIDDATDLLYERGVRPRDVFWLAAPSLRALVWGLHDWAHFHNHGPFDEPAWTELTCDLIALEWLRINRAEIGIDDAVVRSVARDLAALSRERFLSEGKKPPVEDLDALFAGPYPGLGNGP